MLYKRAGSFVLGRYSSEGYSQKRRSLDIHMGGPINLNFGLLVFVNMLDIDDLRKELE
jgi:hypothetical protein